jgi:hypothetical protein
VNINSITITGDGTLSAISDSQTDINAIGIYAADITINIDGGTVNATSSGSANRENQGIYCSTLIVDNGTVNATANTTAYRSVGIFAFNDMIINNGIVNAVSLCEGSGSMGVYSARLKVNGGTLITQGNVYAFFPHYNLTLPASYTYWTNTIASNPGGTGTTYPSGAAFENNNSYKYVKIEEIS